MTNETSITTVDTSILAEFAGGTTGDVEMMIGIGLVKDSDAVFFQYLGEEQTPQALVYNSGKPLTRFANVRLVGIDIDLLEGDLFVDLLVLGLDLVAADVPRLEQVDATQPLRAERAIELDLQPRRRPRSTSSKLIHRRRARGRRRAPPRPPRPPPARPGSPRA